MGLNISSAIGQLYIHTTLNCLQSRKYWKAIMDDLLVFTLGKKSHKAKLEDLLKALLKNGLQISLKKYQLFKKELQYMGNTIFIKGKKMCLKSLRTRVKAIYNVELPTTPKGCRSFVEVVNFLG